MNMIEKRKQQRGQGGFTLIELLVVIAILAILAGVVVFAVGGVTGTASKRACSVEAKTIKTAAEAYKADHNNTPAASISDLAVYLEDEAKAEANFDLSHPGGVPTLVRSTTGAYKDVDPVDCGLAAATP